MLDTDEGNAHNEVDRHTFLLFAREVAPGICRWLEFIYPTECATLVFYKDLPPHGCLSCHGATDMTEGNGFDLSGPSNFVKRWWPGVPMIR